MDREREARTINERKIQRLRKQASTIPEEELVREQSNVSGGGQHPPSALTLGQQRRGNMNSFYLPSERVINEQQPQSSEISGWRRFINFLSCYKLCVKSDSDEGQNSQQFQNNRNSQHPKSLYGSFRTSNNNNSSNLNTLENLSSLPEITSRQASNSSTWLFNILQYTSTGYCALKLGHFSFLQIPVKFERIQAKPKMTLYENISKQLQQNEDACFTLVIQEYFDSELPLTLSAHSAYTLCIFTKTAISIDPNSCDAPNHINNPNPSVLGNSGGARNTPSQSVQCQQDFLFYQQIEASIPKRELSKVDFLRCDDTSVTVQQEQFDKIYIIPTSLKQQGNAFNMEFIMHPEFKKRFLELLNEYADVLYKTVFLLPKYCRIREIMVIIYECFSKSELPIGELNFGIKFHSYINTQQDVEAIALVFDWGQNQDTLAALSHRVFSNIFPDKNAEKKRDLKQNKTDTPRKKKHSGSLPSSSLKRDSYSMTPTKTKETKGGDHFIAVEDEEDGRQQVFGESNQNNSSHDVHLENVSHNDSNSPARSPNELDFGGEEYVEEMSKCTFKQFYGFLKEINACFIIHQDKTFYYRTHIIDVMLAHQLITQQFVPYLLGTIENFDESNQKQQEALMKLQGNNNKQPGQSISPSKFAQEKLSKSAVTGSKQREKNVAANETFKEYFIKNSTQFLNQLQAPPKVSKFGIQVEGANSEFSDIASRTTSDFEHIQGNFRNNSKPLNPFPRSPTEHSTSQQQIDQSQQHSEESIPSSNGAAIPQQVAERIHNRVKQISCNYYSSSTNNKHVGFKSKRQFQSIILDPDILSRTTASRIAENGTDGKADNPIDLKKWRPVTDTFKPSNHDAI